MKFRQAFIAASSLALVIAFGAYASGQQSAVDRLKAMSGDLDALDGKSKEKLRVPFEFFRSQVPPFDVLPYVKRNHWFTLNMEMQANLANYDGLLQTTSEVGGRPQIKLLDMPHGMIYGRIGRMIKEQRSRLGFQMMLTEHIKELNLELTRPDAIRPDGVWAAPLMKLETHQMVIPILAIDPSPFESWKRMQATIPISGDRDSTPDLEKQRYYRLSLPVTDKPTLSPNALCWSNTSHLVWDSLPPTTLPTSQQEALVDWIHLGGQLIVMSAGPNAIAPLEESFLNPYLPATASGNNATLTTDELKSFSDAYPPPVWTSELEEPLDIPGTKRAAGAPIPPRYKAPDTLRPAPGKPLYVVGLSPKEGATAIPLGDPGNHAVAVEWRVGRGRVIMLAVSPNDPAFASWPGMDTFVRRVILRRVEEPLSPNDDRRVYRFLGAPDLTWFRLLTRDYESRELSSQDVDDPNSPLNRMPVAAWMDIWNQKGSESLPVLARISLEQASGITIPGKGFVLKVILAYIIALVPLNWLFCRFVIRRKEWAWAAVPVLALGTAILVERASAYDMGFDSNCSEIDVVEVQGGYPRAHLSRFAAIYSTGRDKYRISYPNDPSALALPLNQQRSLRGEESPISTFESFPEPALKDFQVQPRSLATFRAEAIVDLGGAITLSGDAETGKIENGSRMDLHEAVLIDTATGEKRTLGTIGAGESIAVSGPSSPSKAKPASVTWTDVSPFLAKLEEYRWDIPSERGELRLVAWAPDAHPGQNLEPAVDDHRGFRLVVVHLKYGPMPDPSSPEYYSGPRR